MKKRIYEKPFIKSGLKEEPIFKVIEYKLFLYQEKYKKPYDMGFTVFVKVLFKDLQELNITYEQFNNAIWRLRHLGRVEVSKSDFFKNAKAYSISEKRLKEMRSWGGYFEEEISEPQPKQEEHKLFKSRFSDEERKELEKFLECEEK